jgi:hypothetical protein
MYLYPVLEKDVTVKNLYRFHDIPNAAYGIQYCTGNTHSCFCNLSLFSLLVLFILNCWHQNITTLQIHALLLMPQNHHALFYIAV